MAAKLITALGATPTGTVTFKADGTTITSGVSVGFLGLATCSTSSLTFGLHQITAQYVPATSANYTGSSGSTTQEVGRLLLALVPAPSCTCNGATTLVALYVAPGTQTGAGNPNSSMPARYADGTIKLVANDLSSSGIGVDFGQTRSWTNGGGYVCRTKF